MVPILVTTDFPLKRLVEEDVEGDGHEQDGDG
jgi:hypothetical protein